MRGGGEAKDWSPCWQRRRGKLADCGGRGGSSPARGPAIETAGEDPRSDVESVPLMCPAQEGCGGEISWPGAVVFVVHHLLLVKGGPIVKKMGGEAGLSECLARPVRAQPVCEPPRGSLRLEPNRRARALDNTALGRYQWMCARGGW